MGLHIPALTDLQDVGKSLIPSDLNPESNTYYIYESLGERPRGFLCFQLF